MITTLPDDTSVSIGWIHCMKGRCFGKDMRDLDVVVPKTGNYQNWASWYWSFDWHRSDYNTPWIFPGKRSVIRYESALQSFLIRSLLDQWTVDKRTRDLSRIASIGQELHGFESKGTYLLWILSATNSRTSCWRGGKRSTLVFFTYSDFNRDNDGNFLCRRWEFKHRAAHDIWKNISISLKWINSWLFLLAFSPDNGAYSTRRHVPQCIVENEWWISLLLLTVR